LTNRLSPSGFPLFFSLFLLFAIILVAWPGFQIEVRFIDYPDPDCDPAEPGCRVERRHLTVSGLASDWFSETHALTLASAGGLVAVASCVVIASGRSIVHRAAIGLAAAVAFYLLIAAVYPATFWASKSAWSIEGAFRTTVTDLQIRDPFSEIPANSFVLGAGVMVASLVHAWARRSTRVLFQSLATGGFLIGALWLGPRFLGPRFHIEVVERVGAVGAVGSIEQTGPGLLLQFLGVLVILVGFIPVLHQALSGLKLMTRWNLVFLAILPVAFFLFAVEHGFQPIVLTGEESGALIYEGAVYQRPRISFAGRALVFVLAALAIAATLWSTRRSERRAVVSEPSPGGDAAPAHR
jgi:hypothetical protein